MVRRASATDHHRHRPETATEDSPFAGRQAREAPSSLGPSAIGGLQRGAGNHAVQRAIAGGLPLQRLRDYAKVPVTKLVGPGKMIKATGDAFHYTVTKAESPADAYTDQFHVTFEQGQAAGHPHFYFSDLGNYIPSFENTKQNQNFKNRKGGEKAFPTLKATAKTHASALLGRTDFPAYEGKDLADIAARKKKAAEEKVAEEAAAAAEKAKEDAGVKTVNAVVTTADARKKIAKFKEWLEERAPGGVATVSAKGSELSASIEFVDFAAATAGLPLIADKLWNTKVVTAEIPDP